MKNLWPELITSIFFAQREVILASFVLTNEVETHQINNDCDKKMLKKIIVSLVKAFVVYRLLFDVSSFLYSFSNSARYQPSTSNNGISLITSAQPQPQPQHQQDYALNEKSITLQHDLNKGTHAVRYLHKMQTLKSRLLLEIGKLFNNLKDAIVGSFFSFMKREDNDQSVNEINTRPKNLDIRAQSNIPIPHDADKTEWGGLLITEKEIKSLEYLHLKANGIDHTSNDLSLNWVTKATTIDFLRFLRSKNGNQEEAFRMILAHAKWRISKYGADTIRQQNLFQNSELNKEIFWLGVSTTDCPTLVVRTQAHDGADYNEDPKIFSR